MASSQTATVPDDPEKEKPPKLTVWALFSGLGVFFRFSHCVHEEAKTGLAKLLCNFSLFLVSPDGIEPSTL